MRLKENGGGGRKKRGGESRICGNENVRARKSLLTACMGMVPVYGPKDDSSGRFAKFDRRRERRDTERKGVFRSARQLSFVVFAEFYSRYGKFCYSEKSEPGLLGQNCPQDNRKYLKNKTKSYQ